MRRKLENLRKNSKVFNAYMRMLEDGVAFINYEDKPDANTRKMIVDYLKYNKQFPYTDTFSTSPKKVKKVILHSKQDEELERLLESMIIKEEEVLI